MYFNCLLADTDTQEAGTDMDTSQAKDNDKQPKSTTQKVNFNQQIGLITKTYLWIFNSLEQIDYYVAVCTEIS